ncbi:MAG: hypothetical protein ACREL9_06215 [Gemmatimonadales bacterium]
MLGRRASRASDRFAASLRGFGPVGILAILVILAGNLDAAVSPHSAAPGDQTGTAR